MSRVYIAGRVSCLQYVVAQLNFLVAEGWLQKQGHTNISNPMKIVPKGTEWPEAMRMCIKAMMDCDTVYMLRDWQKSRGARMERRLAMSIGMKIMYEK